MRIAARLRLLGVGLVVATALLIGATVYWGYVRMVAIVQERNLSQLVEQNSARLELRFGELRDDLRLIAGMADTRACTIGNDAEARDRLAATFARLIEVKPWYDQVRLIAREGDGREILRLDLQGQSPVRTPEAELQPKGHRDYMADTRTLAAGDYYLSDVTLNREGGKLEVPHRPMVRGAVPIMNDDATQWGIVIINVAFDRFIGAMLPKRSEHFSYYITNDKGDYLVHPDPDLTFGFEFGTPHRVQDQLPKLEPVIAHQTERMALRAETTEPHTVGTFVEAQHLHVFPSGDPRYLVLIILHWDAALAGQTAAIGLRVGVVIVLLVLAALAISQWFARRLARPLEDIAGAAGRLPEGLDDADLPTHRRDEIGILSRALSSMMHALGAERTKLIQSNQKLEVANRDLEHFAHIASHDLREPARRVAIMADLLLVKESDSLNPEGAGILKRLRASANHMLSQIMDFRALVGIGHGQMTREPVNMRDVVRSVLEEFADATQSRNATIEIGELPTTEAYPSLVHVLYRGLTENAIGHSRETGFVLSYQSALKNGVRTFTVRNSGSSIPKRDLQRIFDPFTRLAEHGSGMGLSVCRRIVERHGGGIVARSGVDWVEIEFWLEDSEHGN